MAAVEATSIVATESSTVNATKTATTASCDDGLDKPMTIETASSNDRSSSSHLPLILTSTPSSMSTPTETASATLPAEIGLASANDYLDSSPRAMQNLALVVAATSDLLETSPRSMVMLLMETPTSQAETPNSNVNLNDTPEPKAKTKPKGILRKPRYLASKQLPVNTTTITNISPTTENTIQNTNQGRKNRRGDFGYGFDDDDEDSNEHRNSNTAMSIVWSLIVLPVILLSYGGLPYVVVASMAWMLIFVARWFRRFLAEEFSMRRNSKSIGSSSSLNEIARTTNGREQQRLPMIPPSLESPFSTPTTNARGGVSSNNTSSDATLPSILSEISPMVGARSKKIRFEKGIKFPVKKFLRQPVPRIQKNRNPTPKNRKNSSNNNHHRNIPGSNSSSSIKQPLLFASPEEENNVEGDSWSLDSLMVLRNYMKDHNNRNSNISNASNAPSSVSVMIPPSQEEDPTFGEEATPPPFPTSTENSSSSGDEAGDEAEGHSDEDTSPCESVQNSSASSYSSESEDDDNDEVRELPNSSTSDGRRRESVMFFPQEIVEEEDTAYESRYGHSYEQPAIQLYDDADDENKYNEDFHEGLFGTTSNDSDSYSPRKNKASRYRRRKPRDSLCFTFAKKTVVPECPSIPQCPSDELEYLEQKIQEKFQQAVVIEHHYEAPFPFTSVPTNSKPGEAPTIDPEDSADEISLEAISLETPPATSETDLVVGNETQTEKEPKHNQVFQLPPWKAQGGDGETANFATLTSGSWDAGETSVLSDVLPPTLSLDNGEDEDEFEYDYNFDYESNRYDEIDNVQDDGEKEEEEASSHNKANDVSPPPADGDHLHVSLNLCEKEAEHKEIDEGTTGSSECSNNEVQPSLVVLEERDFPPFIESDDKIIEEVSQSSVGVQDLPLDDEANEWSTNDNANLQDLPIDEEPASMNSMGDSSQNAELLQDELSLDEEAASLPQLRQPEEEISSGGIDDSMPFTDFEELAINDGTPSVTDDLPVVNDLQVTPVDDEVTSCTNDDSSQFTDPEDISLDEEFVAMGYSKLPQLNDLQDCPISSTEKSLQHTDMIEASRFDDLNDLERDVLRFTNLQELAIDELHSSFRNDEALQISFDTMESDDVECILSPNALNMSDDEIMFRDRESVVHIPFTDTKTTTFNEIDAELLNRPITHEVLTASSDLIIEKVATNEDVECILSPLPLVDTDFTAFDESDTEFPNDAIIRKELNVFTDVESNHIAPSSLEPPESLGNKENAENYDDVEKMAFGKRKNSFCVDTSTTKVVEDMNSSSSSAFLRSALSPTN